ncbi:MAG: TetR/AcrR family transcriptional regulator [Arenimonas sp.]|uniref:TetR/AcrR family transcriptional regulator n=1 Tax=Arenimonas sp. TaxID=1872635 RepID=UPI0025C27BAF|nr:TetR/AcrR family transcriptional regulator [Arenimonas sp.]MBW8366377.1 TetR/AcrR family transcriptional regulator [Arenimonas sp.]
MNLAANSPSKAEQRALVQRTRILDAARSCFAESGFHGASIAAIAESAGMSQGLIYRYFTNKAAIVHAIVEEQRQGRGEALAGIESCHALVDLVMGKLERWRDSSTRFGSEFDPILFLEITAEATRDPDVAAVLATNEQSVWCDLSDVIRRDARASGKVLDEAQVQQRTIVLRCLVDGAILNWIRDPSMDPQQLRRSLDAVCDTLLT